MKVLAVVVTHNRCQLLSRCLDYLELQTVKPDAVVVINNGSTDDTAQMLRKRQVLTLNQDNLGSAGGWHRGMQYAADKGFDAIWLMDDDGFPAADALGILKANWHPRLACLSSVVVREDDRARFVFPLRIFGGLVNIKTTKDLLRFFPDGVAPTAHLFNGALIGMRAILEVGYVNPNYFVYGDEIDFFFRLKRAGQVASIVKAQHLHPNVNLRSYSEEKIYYYLKNTIIINSLYYRWFWLRCSSVLLLLLFRIAHRNGIVCLGRYAPSVTRAIYRGFLGKLGRDF